MTAPIPLPVDRQPEPPSRVHLIPFDQIKLGAERRYLVKGLIPRVGLTIVWGPPKSGKSFWMFDTAMHVALGWAYRGRRVQKGSVIYCAFEGQSGLEARVEAFRQRFLGEDVGLVPFYLQPVTLDLVADQGELIAVIRRQIAAGAALVVLDTLNRSLRGSESSDEDMSAYVKAADAIREAFNCAVVIVHHCGIDGSRPRGHTSLTGAADAQISVKRDAGDNIAVTIELAKDGPQGDTLLSRLEVVEVGIDEDGETITSCVIVSVEGDLAQGPKAKPSLSAPAQKVLSAFYRLFDEERTHPAPPSAPGIGPGTRAVTMGDLREAAFRLGVFPEPEPIDSDERKRWRNTRNTAYRRAYEAVENAGLLRSEEGFVWNPAMRHAPAAEPRS